MSRLTAKYQATIPREVRDTLHLGAGDRVEFLVRDGQVTLRKVTADDEAVLRALQDTLGEWDSVEDDEAWRDL